MSISTPVASPSVPRAGLAWAVFGMLADQFSKYYMVEKVFRPEGVTETPFSSPVVIDVLPFFQFSLSWNRGISFSLFSASDARWALVIATSIIATVLFVWMWRTPRGWLQIGLGLIVGGALGNIIDRVLVGAVADFLHVYWQDWHFPTFNIADSCITVGAIIVLLDALFERPHDGKQAPTEA